MSARRLRACAVPAGLALIAGLLAPIPAFADETPGLEQMDQYPAAAFSEQAAELPADLVDALARDVEQTPEEYLAQSAAAVQAVEVVDSLEAAGIGVLGSRLDGTELIVNVDSESEAVVVESTGAVAELGEPAPTWDPTGLTMEFTTDLFDGQGWAWSSNNFSTSFTQCSVGFTGRLVATGAPELATAGHCTNTMTGSARILEQSAPNVLTGIGAVIGSKVSGATFWGSGDDVGRIAANGSGIAQQPAVLRWGGGAAAPFANTPGPVTGPVAAMVGATLCKSGSRTGWTCGPIEQSDYVADVGGVMVNSVVAKLCTLPGDSGGSGLIGRKAVGITSWTTASTAANTGKNYCVDSSPVYAGFFQMISPLGQNSVAARYGSAWEMMASVSSPTITSVTSNSGGDTVINGKVPEQGVGYSVDIYIDGSSTKFAAVGVNAGTGVWSVNVASLANGLHSFSAVARYGTWSTSAPTTGFVKRGVSVNRIYGANRYETSAAIAAGFSGSNTVYLANGLKYPDALSAASAAGSKNAPLLLTQPDVLPDSIATALESAAPSKVVILGGADSISDSVLNSVVSMLPGAQVVRIAGPDRFATSLLVSQNSFASSTTAYVATGLNFPDALSAAAAAGDIAAPVILVNGTASTLDTPTRNLLVSLGVTTVKIAGSDLAVSTGIANAIDAIPGVGVIRFAGADRYKTSVAINKNAFTSATTAYLAVGTGFADALSGAALAGRQGVPLFVVPGNCVPPDTLDAMKTMGVTSIYLLGSSDTLDANVFALRSC